MNAFTISQVVSIIAALGIFALQFYTGNAAANGVVLSPNVSLILATVAAVLGLLMNQLQAVGRSSGGDAPAIAPGGVNAPRTAASRASEIFHKDKFWK